MPPPHGEAAHPVRPWLICGVLLLFASLAAFAVLNRFQQRRADTQAIRAVFARHEAAYQAGDADALAALTGPETRNWLAEMLKAAAADTRAQLRARSIDEQIFILQLRHDFTRPHLE